MTNTSVPNLSLAGDVGDVAVTRKAKFGHAGLGNARVARVSSRVGLTRNARRRQASCNGSENVSSSKGDAGIISSSVGRGLSWGDRGERKRILDLGGARSGWVLNLRCGRSGGNLSLSDRSSRGLVLSGRCAGGASNRGVGALLGLALTFLPLHFVDSAGIRIRVEVLSCNTLVDRSWEYWKRKSLERDAFFVETTLAQDVLVG